MSVQPEVSCDADDDDNNVYRELQQSSSSSSLSVITGRRTVSPLYPDHNRL